MATVIPSWCNVRYLENILRNAEANESIEISDLTVKPALEKVENFASDMYRIGVKLSWAQNGDKLREEKSIILKVLPHDDKREEWILSSRIYDTELSILSKTLPKIEKILAGLSSTPLGARCFHVHYEKPVHVIVEDLKPKGFRMVTERKSGLDLGHCLLAMQNLGRFHAASIALNEKEPMALKNYAKGRYHMDEPLSYRNLINNSATCILQKVIDWPELDPRIGDKLLKLCDLVYEKVHEASRYLKDDFNVLNHGDFWMNNMMFRYDDQEKPIDHIFVDFQRCCWTSPAVDILYFLGSSPSYDVRFQHRELLLREYHSSLTNVMNKLQCTTEAPSFDKLQEILQKRAFCEVFTCTTILPCVILKKDENLEPEEMLVEEFGNSGYHSKIFKKIMTRLFPLFDSMGILDM